MVSKHMFINVYQSTAKSAASSLFSPSVVAQREGGPHTPPAIATLGDGTYLILDHILQFN